VQISASNETKISSAQLDNIKSLLKKAAITVKAVETQKNKVLVRFNNTDEQMRAADLLRNSIGNKLTVALNLTRLRKVVIFCANANFLISFISFSEMLKYRIGCSSATFTFNLRNSVSANAMTYGGCVYRAEIDDTYCEW
jgi:hypothetical protein